MYGDIRVRVLENFTVPHAGFVVRTRVMCQAGRARFAGGRGTIIAWLCERAPLWVIVHVCALLRERYRREGWQRRENALKLYL